MLGRLGKSALWLIAALLVIALLASGVLLANALGNQRNTGDEIRQHFENVLTLRQTQAMLVDAETGQRGYLLTSSPTYLTPYQRSRVEIPQLLRRLEVAAVTRPGDTFEALTQAKLGELDDTVRLAQSGQRTAALAIVAGDSGKRYMDQLRGELGSRISVQQKQLETALRRSDEYTRRTYWALALLAGSIMVLLWLGARTLLRTQRLEAETERLREVEQAERRTALIARELNHRVKNLFSVVLAIVTLAARGSATPKEAVDRIRERVQALANAHEVSLGNDPMAGFDLEAILRAILAPYVSESERLTLSGPPLQLPVMRATPLGLILHELATNAVKYGAWSGEGGHVGVEWAVSNSNMPAGNDGLAQLHLNWTENSPFHLAEDGPNGFGSKLMNAAVAQLDGTLRRERGDHGLAVVITAPIVPVDQGGPHA